MAKWLPPHGFTGKVHAMDAKVGGGYRMSFTSFGGTFLELTPHRRIRYTDQFDDPALPGTMHVTVELGKGSYPGTFSRSNSKAADRALTRRVSRPKVRLVPVGTIRVLHHERSTRWRPTSC